MEKSKLLDLLGTFSGQEWRSFRELVRSPFFNRNEDMITLCDWLSQNFSPTLDRKAVFKAALPNTRYNEAQMNHLMSAMLKLGEQFIGMIQMERNGFWTDFFTLQGLSERGLEKHYRFLFEKKQQALSADTNLGTRHYWEQYWLNDLESNRQTQSAATGHIAFVQRASDSLDYFYLAEKLRFACFMLTSERLLAVPYRIQMAEEAAHYLAQHPLPNEAPAVKAYFLVFQLFNTPDAHGVFEQLRDALPALQQQLGPAETEEIYQYAINFCNLQILQLREQYLAEAFNLYLQAIESGVMLKNGQLSPWHFKNVIKLALRLKKHTWTEQFIQSHAQLLPPDLRSDAYHFNLAELYYYTGENEKAQFHLNRVASSDPSYHLGAKIMLAKIYYETEAYDALESLLHAFVIYLRRNRTISEEIRRTYLNFATLLRRLMQARPDQYAALRVKIEGTKLLAGKTWFLKVLGGERAM